MSDPLSVVASVAGLVSVSASILRMAKDLYCNVKDAPDSIQRVIAEMGDMNMIFSKVKRFIDGDGKRPMHARLTMISIYDLEATLSGCVLVCDRLNKHVNAVAGVVNPSSAERKTALVLARVKWALWKEAEASAILGELQRHKLSLNVMLNIIQCESSEEATRSLGELSGLVEQLLDSNYQLRQTNHTISDENQTITIQLRELIQRRHADNIGQPELDAPDSTDSRSSSSKNTCRTTQSAGNASTSSSTLIETSQKGDDRVSIKTTATFRSFSSLRSAVPLFSEVLNNSRIYKLTHRRHSRFHSNNSDAHSLFSANTGATKHGGWSMLSDMSLGDLSISEVSVLDLPICLSDIWDSSPYLLQQPASNPQQRRRRTLNYISRGRIHNAIKSNNEFVVRTLLALGADVEERLMTEFGVLTPVAHAALLNRESICRLLLSNGASTKPEVFEGIQPVEYPDMARRGYVFELGGLIVRHEPYNPVCVQVQLLAAIVNHCAIFWRNYWGFHCPDCNLAAALPNMYSHAGVDITAGYLHFALKNGLPLTVLRFLLAMKPDVEELDEKGRTPIFYAVSKFQEALLQVQIRKRETPLMHGESTHSERTAQMLGASGADLDLDNRKGPNWTLIDSYADNLSQLLSEGMRLDTALVDINTSFKGYIHEAIRNFAQFAVMMLLEMGVNIEELDDRGLTPLMHAARSGFLAWSLRRFHLQLKNTSSEACWQTSLTQSSVRHRPIGPGEDQSIASILSKKGANIEARDLEMRTALMHAVQYHHKVTTKILLDMGADVETCDSEGQTPLMYASRYGVLSLIRLLLEGGADIEARDSKRRTPLMYALLADSGRLTNNGIQTTEILLEKGADIEARDPEGRTPLVQATESGSTAHETTKLLLEKGANVEARDSKGLTPLMHASRSGFKDIIQLLLESGADIEARDPEGRTPLVQATESGSTGHETTRLLLKKGANVEARDFEGLTPLMHASRSGLFDIFQLLLEGGADINARDSECRTPLMHTASVFSMFNVAILRLLLEKGADVRALDSEGQTTLMHALRSGSSDMTRLLLESGADIEACDFMGHRTPLMHAAESIFGFKKIAVLLEKGANIEARDYEGQTPLMHAARSRSVGCSLAIYELLKGGADIEACDNQGQTPLMHAAGFGCIETTQVLLQSGAEIEACDYQGETPLMQAVGSKSICEGWRRIQVAQLLINLGASLSIENNIGQTPYHYAKIMDNTEMTDLLWANLSTEQKKLQDPERAQRKADSFSDMEFDGEYDGGGFHERRQRPLSSFGFHV